VTSVIASYSQVTPASEMSVGFFYLHEKNTFVEIPTFHVALLFLYTKKYQLCLLKCSKLLYARPTNNKRL